MKSRVAATLLAFFLGWFGVHKFYLGKITAGVLYLVFFWTFIPSILAFIDFIILLVMNDQDFNAKYNGIHQDSYGNVPVYINNYHASKDKEIPFDNRENVNSRNENPVVTKQMNALDPFEEDGDEKYAAYDFNGAIYDYLRSLKIRAKNPNVHFKLACLYSFLEETDSAYHHLAKAVEYGYINLSEVHTNEKLEHLRQDKDFETFVKNKFVIPNEVKLDLSERLELSDAIITRIERLAKLRDDGIINDDEFQQQKTKILNH